MEKMQLGSPAGGSPTPHSYLPNFLMGVENTPTNRSFSNSPTASPDFSRSSLQQRFLTGLQSPNAAFPNNNNTSLNQSIQQQQSAAVYQAQNNNNNNTSISGPPINSLFDNLRSDNKSFQTPSKNFYQPQIVHQDTPQINTSGFNQSRIFSPIPFNDLNNSYQIGSTAQIAPNQSFNIINASMNAPGNRFNQSDFWVTVFGFPSEAVTFILSHFSTCGTILEKVCSSGNWIHLRFSSRGECDKALLYNGKIIGNNIMIGVIRCQDESITDKENSIDCSRASVNKIRSLTQAAYKNAKIEHEVIPSMDDPKKSTGIVNKAMDLLFGW